MNKQRIFDELVVWVDIVLFVAIVWFSGYIMRFGVFCESQLPSIQEEFQMMQEK